MTKPANARSASGAQRSARGMAGPFARPTVPLATQDYPNSEPAIDLITEPNIRLGNSLVAAFGRPTPLDPQVVTRAYAVPPPFSQECKTLTTGLTTQNGYNPGLAPASMGSPTCLAHAHTNIAILNQKGSSFPARYGARFRTAGKIGCKAGGANARARAVSYGVLDLTFGQEQIESPRHLAISPSGWMECCLFSQEMQPTCIRSVRPLRRSEETRVCRP